MFDLVFGLVLVLVLVCSFKRVKKKEEKNNVVVGDSQKQKNYFIIILKLYNSMVFINCI